MKIERHESASGGDCLFDSISTAMDEPMSKEQVRELVAQTVLDPGNSEATNAICNWKMLLISALESKDDEFAVEFRHVSHIVKHVCNPGSPVDDPSRIPTILERSVLFQVMKQPQGLYWGDEYSIIVLQRELNVNIIPMSPGSRPNLTGTNKDLNYILLLIKNRHYEPVSVDGIFLLNYKTVQEALKIVYP